MSAEQLATIDTAIELAFEKEHKSEAEKQAKKQRLEDDQLSYLEQFDYQDWSCNNLRASPGDLHGDGYNAVSDRVREKCAEIETQYKSWKAEKKQKYHNALISHAIKIDASIEARYQAGLDDPGCDNEFGYCDEDELLDIIDAHYLPRKKFLGEYRLLNLDDFEHTEEYCQGSVSFCKRSPQTLDAKSFDYITRAKTAWQTYLSAFKEITAINLKVRGHYGECDECDGKVVRYGLLVKITIDDCITVSREYAIQDSEY